MHGAREDSAENVEGETMSLALNVCSMQISAESCALVRVSSTALWRTSEAQEPPA